MTASPQLCILQIVLAVLQDIVQMFAVQDVCFNIQQLTIRAISGYFVVNSELLYNLEIFIIS